MPFLTGNLLLEEISSSDQVSRKKRPLEKAPLLSGRKTAYTVLGGEGALRCSFHLNVLMLRN